MSDCGGSLVKETLVVMGAVLGGGLLACVLIVVTVAICVRIMDSP